MFGIRNIRERVTKGSARRYPEDREHSMQMASHGSVGEEQPVADLIVGEPGSSERRDLAFLRP